MEIVTEQMNQKPLIVQSDYSILVEVNSQTYPQVRDQLSRFAELVKSPEHIHTYRLTPLSLWNAASSGMNGDQIKQVLQEFSKYPVPSNVLLEIEHLISRYGKIELHPSPLNKSLSLKIFDLFLAEQLIANPKIRPFLKQTENPSTFFVEIHHRGNIKNMLIKLGYPVVDLVGYVLGEYCAIQLRKKNLSGEPFNLRDYQIEAAEIFYQGGTARGGSGVIVLPCGSGKTIVGLIVMSKLKCQTLIICTSVAAAHQWIREILDKTELSAEMVGEYTGDKKQVRPITVATYQIVTHQKFGTEELDHFDLLDSNNWGLIIYDEVHLLPAPLFRITAQLQAKRRLGLTATLVREDQKEEDVFSLIGPKRYDVPWKELESRGWIAEAICHELRVPLADSEKLDYAQAESRSKFRIASMNSWKFSVIVDLLNKHRGEPTLIIGQYLDQLKRISGLLRIPLITGQTPNKKRESCYQEFQAGKIPILIVSRVANFSIDLPDARVLIQISGLFGSRQEEAQRLGRILRPKSKSSIAHFYTLVTSYTLEQEFAHHRQLFLIEQGYRYQIEDYTEDEIKEIVELEEPYLTVATSVKRDE